MQSWKGNIIGNHDSQMINGEKRWKDNTPQSLASYQSQILVGPPNVKQLTSYKLCKSGSLSPEVKKWNLRQKEVRRVLIGNKKKKSLQYIELHRDSTGPSDSQIELGNSALLKKNKHGQRRFYEAERWNVITCIPCAHLPGGAQEETLRCSINSKFSKKCSEVEIHTC